MFVALRLLIPGFILGTGRFAVSSFVCRGRLGLLGWGFRWDEPSWRREFGRRSVIAELVAVPVSIVKDGA